MPIVDMAAMVLTLAYVLCCATVLRLRHLQLAPSPVLVPGGPFPIWVAGIGAIIMAASAFISPFWAQPGTLPLEHRIFGVWSVVGVVVWLAWVRNRY